MNEMPFYVEFESIAAFNMEVASNPEFVKHYREADPEVMRQAGAIVWQRRLRGV